MLFLKKGFTRRKNMLKLISEDIDGWKLHALEFVADKKILKKIVLGKLSNSQTDAGKAIRFDCQINIAKQIKSIRGIIPRSDKNEYAISLGLKFSRPLTQKQQLDIDNFIKPIFAGIAAGLFSSTDEYPKDVIGFTQYNDSCFRHLIVERLDDHANEEGVAIVVSEKQ